MIRRIFSAAAIALSLVVSVPSASTAAVVFNLGGPPTGNALSYSYAVSGLTAVATASRPLLGAANVNRSNSSLGVQGGLPFAPVPNDIGAVETLTLTFSSLVQILSVTFANVDSNDDADILIDGAQRQGDVPLSGLPGGVYNTTAFNFVGKSIGFRADQYDGPFAGQQRDDFRVASITVSAIPLPLTGVLLLGGLGALAFAARRKAAA